MAARRGCPLRACACVLLCVAHLHVAAAYNVSDVVRVFQRSQEELAAAWRYNANLVCQPPGLHGFVEKRASGRVIGDVLAKSDVVPVDVMRRVPMYGGFQVYVSHSFKFVYIRQPKASSCSIIKSIIQMFCQGPPHPGSCGHRDFSRLGLQNINDTMWRDYFVFTVVRNPIARMLSTYLMFTEHLRKRLVRDSHRPGQFCNIPFLEFARDVLRLRTACDTHQCCAYVAKGKNQFVEHLVDAHISMQVHGVLTPDGDSMVDYVGATEHMNEDWPKIVAAIEARSGKHVPFMPLMHSNTFRIHTKTLLRMGLPLPKAPFEGGDNATAAAAPPHPPCLHRDVASLGLLNETTVLAIARQFAMDMLMLRYLPAGAPPGPDLPQRA